ncbi:MAG: cystathionine beta-synthase [Candidatus Fluviicola riflensis]|nr:MAG: cystathionine beta-synthase [Candidatus Fluviicola riflensis]OGS79340.1 MAG: cystathionine beta-synthase [Candidatus Fluviicola riflensis]OGS86772.1 MAG: cystathionine beta-synthase [Fluviicola sp. RIFCSPHIGHO2_01_FULL_43_53]OGS88755.1 MAG: cystathionine beta-synthase [Fluviicola sp. RIFCSPHIGHO2_12_FULL_43_24]
MKIYNNILETIGNTPLVKLNKLTADVKATVLAKVETTNPGNSVKDRMAVKMIEDAEASGLLKPGGTIIEGTSGNTGMGLALVAIIKGYKLICVLNDKQSKEKMDILRAVGAEVVVCPTAVEPTDPRSYYSVSKRLAKEIPNSWYVNQYDNLSNRIAHYEQTGPEIWEQTDGKVTHFVVGVGTGGTISGVGKYLKEKNPNIKIWGIDTYGSVFKKYKETGVFDENEIYPYITEGIGEDILPANVDFDVIDLFEKVTDKDAAVYTRRLAREEGIFVGNSAGAAIGGLLQLKDKLTADDVVVVLFHDHGSRYVGKIFNDDWMRERGFLDENLRTAEDLIARHADQPLVTLYSEELVSHAIMKMRKFNISQIPVLKDGQFVGSLSDNQVYQLLVDNPTLRDTPISKVMQAPFPVVQSTTKIEDVAKLINNDVPAVLVERSNGNKHILTRQDIISSLS